MIIILHFSKNGTMSVVKEIASVFNFSPCVAEHVGSNCSQCSSYPVSKLHQNQ